MKEQIFKNSKNHTTHKFTTSGHTNHGLSLQSLGDKSCILTLQKNTSKVIASADKIGALNFRGSGEEDSLLVCAGIEAVAESKFREDLFYQLSIVPLSVPGPGKGGWVIGQSAIILRVDSDVIDPHSLFTYLRSNIGQSLLYFLMVSIRCLAES